MKSNFPHITMAKPVILRRSRRISTKFRCFAALSMTLTTLTSSNLFAKEQHGAHEHGKAKLDIAVDGTKVVLNFESPADSIYGFEHEAKSTKDIAKRDKAAKQLKDDANSLFQFQPALNCNLTDSKIEPWITEKSHHGKHGEVHASYTFTCVKSPTGTKLTVTLTDKFKHLSEIAVQLISDQKQTGAVLKSGSKTIDL